MTQHKLRVASILSSFTIITSLVMGNFAQAVSPAPAYKEYRNASSVSISGQTYLLVTNNSSVEILKFNPASALVPVSELRLPQKIKDVVTVTEGKETFAYVTTGRYIYRIKITNPNNMEVMVKRDVFEYRRGFIRTGSVESLATNGKVLITAGQYGVRAMGLSNLLVEKYYYYDTAYGVAVNNQNVQVLGEQKAYNFNLATGKEVMKADIKNVDKQIRRPALDATNAGYAISDNAIIKMLDGKVITYTNPDKTVKFSYTAAATGKAVYYVNGYGVTKFDKNLKKTAFLKTSASNRFGDRAWAVGVTTVNVNGSEKIIVMNKSSILVLSSNLTVLSTYKNANTIQNNPEQIVKFDRQSFLTNQAIVASMTGFYPNEMVKLTINKKVYQVKSNNLGEAMISFNTPSTPGKYLIDVSVASSPTSYQVVRDVR